MFLISLTFFPQWSAVLGTFHIGLLVCLEHFYATLQQTCSWHFAKQNIFFPLKNV